jgi:ribosomal-protein-alanine N-acetyltransferase
VTEGISLRPAADDDPEWCARLMASSEPWITLGRDYDRSLAVLRDAAREVHVAWSGGERVGFVILCLGGPFTGYLQTLCVAPGGRGRGIGSSILAWAEARIFERSPNVFLCVSSFNRDARRLYERAGYAFVGELTDYLVEGHSELLFRKTRGPWSAFGG